jgi:hypothetical protein
MCQRLAKVVRASPILVVYYEGEANLPGRADEDPCPLNQD